MTSVLSTQNLCKSFGPKVAVDSLSFNIESGQIYGILGPNGSGKTTTLAMVLGVLKQSSGSIRWFNSENSSSARKKVGSLLEQPNFYPWISCQKNLEITALQKGLFDPAEIESHLREVGLYDVRHRPFSKLSLGMKQRLAIANCLIGNPEVLILDEPTNGIDAQGIVDIRHIIKNQGDQGKTVILASHILDEVEKVCTHTLILKDGRVISDGAIGSVLGGVTVVKISFSEKHGSLPETSVIVQFIEGLSFIKNVVTGGNTFTVELEQDAEPFELGKALYEKGWNLNQLESAQGGLEKKFVKLLEEQA